MSVGRFDAPAGFEPAHDEVSKTSALSRLSYRALFVVFNPVTISTQNLTLFNFTFDSRPRATVSNHTAYRLRLVLVCVVKVQSCWIIKSTSFAASIGLDLVYL